MENRTPLVYPADTEPGKHKKQENIIVHEMDPWDLFYNREYHFYSNAMEKSLHCYMPK